MAQIFGIIKELLDVKSAADTTTMADGTSTIRRMQSDCNSFLENPGLTNVFQEKKVQLNGYSVGSHNNENMHQHDYNDNSASSSHGRYYNDTGGRGQFHDHHHQNGHNTHCTNNTHTNHSHIHFHPYHNNRIQYNNSSSNNNSSNNNNSNNNNDSNSNNNNENNYWQNNNALSATSAFHSNVVVGVCGGGPVREDLNKLNSNTKVLVATPGRLLDLCERQKISMSQIKYLVIDECDKLLDMGLEEQLRKIVALVMVHKTSPQVSLWSATLPDSLERLARSAVVNPVYIIAGAKDTISSNIEQRVMFLHSYMKEEKLLDVLRRIPYPPVIIFVQSKQTCDEVTELLLEEQFHVGGIHADKLQTHRNQVVEDFRKGEIDVLVATDLMSRGIDIPSVTHIVNFDTPATIEDYIHRCGRCGRLGREGVATTFLTLECKFAEELKDMLEASGNDVPRELMDVSDFGKKVMKTEMGDRVIT